VGEPDIPERAGKELNAFYVGDRAPRIDGRLDDEIWAAAQGVDDMVQNDPDNMKAPTERTLVKVAYDDRAVYVGVVNYMRDVSKITTALGRRDTNPRSDSIKITFDPRHDHLTAYTFDSNPSGVQGDMTWFDDTRSSSDYDAVWEVRTERTAEGWTAEFRIPFSQMRFSVSPGEAAVWGFNIRRDIVHSAETDRWVATPRGVQGFVSRFGHLTFSKAPAPPRRLEVQPFLLGRQQHVTDEGYGRGLSGGVDFRMGLGTATTLSAAVNPDFGQVEQDPAVLNLSVFETFFPEKRPFFIEDSRTLVSSFGQMPMFHSRRIGQRPGRFAVADGETVIERPDATTILGATKVTGKAKGWSYGGLSALTDREYATVEKVVSGDIIIHEERLIEPYTSYNVGRVQKDVRGGSIVGGSATAVLREKDVDAYSGAIDYNIRWNKNRYSWNGQWATTRAAIDGVMQTGFGGLTNFNYSNKHFGAFGRYEHFDRDFRNTDLGFLFGRNNKRTINGGFNLGQPDPKKYFRNATMFSNFFTQWNGDKLLLDSSFFAGGEIQFLNYWNMFMGTGRFLKALRRPRHPRWPADPEARRLVLRLVSRQRLPQAVPRVGQLQHVGQRRRRHEPALRRRTAVSAGAAAADVDQRQLQRRPRRRAVGRERRRHRRWRRGPRLRHARPRCRERDGAHHLCVHPRHDARGLPAAVRGGGRLFEHPDAGTAEVVRLHAHRAVLRSRLQQQVAPQQRGVPLGIQAGQHAVCRLERLQQRFATAG
jgi:hypothetical protein